MAIEPRLCRRIGETVQRRRQHADESDAANQHGCRPPDARSNTYRPYSRILCRSTQAFSSASARDAIAISGFGRHILIRPNEAFANRGRVAHQRRNRGVVLFSIFKPAHDSSVKTRPLGHIADAQPVLLTITLQGLQRTLDAEVHSHCHEGIRVAVTLSDQVLEGWLLALQLLAELVLTGSLRRCLLARAKNTPRLHFFLRFFPLRVRAALTASDRSHARLSKSLALFHPRVVCTSAEARASFAR